MIDVTTRNEGTVCCLTPRNWDAKQWLEQHLPDDCPKMGKNIWVVETNYVGPIIAGLMMDDFAVATEAEWREYVETQF